MVLTPRGRVGGSAETAPSAHSPVVSEGAGTVGTMNTDKQCAICWATVPADDEHTRQTPDGQILTLCPSCDGKLT